MGEGPHASVQKFFVRFLGNREREWSIRVWPEQRVQTSPMHFRVPDVTVTRSSAPFEDIVTVAPLLCIEILSRDDRMSDMQERVDDYLAMGVCMVWIVDPRRRKTFQTDGLSLQPVEELTVPGTEIVVAKGEVFAELDELKSAQ